MRSCNKKKENKRNCISSCLKLAAVLISPVVDSHPLKLISYQENWVRSTLLKQFNILPPLLIFRGRVGPNLIRSNFLGSLDHWPSLTRFGPSIHYIVKGQVTKEVERSVCSKLKEGFAANISTYTSGYNLEHKNVNWKINSFWNRFFLFNIRLVQK